MLDIDGTVRYDSLPPERIGRQPPGYRAPEQLRLGTVSLQIAELERSVAYYRDIIGLQLLEKSVTPEERRAQMGAPGNSQPLLELCEKPGVRRAREGGRLGLYHFALLLPDRAHLGRLLLHLAAAGVQFGHADHYFSEALYLTDPDGLQIEVYRDRPRSEWRVRPDGELVGTTEALDLRRLAASAGDRRWDGVPEGTIIGHVHFHVGNLAEAEAFYHRGLGLDVVISSFPGALFLSAGGYHHHVGTNTWAAGAGPAQDDEARLLSWEMVLPGDDLLETAAVSLETAGFEVGKERGHLKATDPNGISVRLRAASSS